MGNRDKTSWSLDEIDLLDELLKLDVSSSHIANMLGRSRAAVQHATVKLVYQQLLDHTPEVIALRYNKPISWVESGIVDDKFRVLEDADDAFVHGSRHTSRLLLSVMSSLLCTTVSTGMVYFGYLLYENGFGR